VIRAEVGDTIRIYFKNMLPFPVSMHPHGVFYLKESEGAPYNDGLNFSGGAVPPGQMHAYVLEVPERAGPASADASTILWSYHSHTDEIADVAGGLIGPIVICRRGGCDENRVPSDVDREFFLVFFIINENVSPYLERNIELFTDNDTIIVDPEDEGFIESNLMHAINGYVYGNQPMMEMNDGETIRWYLIGMGNENDMHTVHWHGQTLVEGGHRRDTLAVLPAESFTLDMIADDPGIWLLHCHVDDHMEAGMQTRYVVNGVI